MDTVSALEGMVTKVRHALSAPGAEQNAIPGVPPRLELFHAANSICSQKVRVVLAHHHLPYMSRSLALFTGETYLPSYVSLRMAGCDGLDLPLVSTHTGSTSFSAGGCDPAVVPTLVDWDQGEIVLDSKRICLHLDAHRPEADRLRPASLGALIDAELAIVDDLPNYQMLMGRAPGATEARGGGGGPEFSLAKVARCDRYLTEYAADGTLARAYAAKRAKELEAAKYLFSEDAMRRAYTRAEAACGALEATLNSAATPWLFGASVTLADLFWVVELLRMKNLGAHTMWDDGRLPRVAGFLAAGETLPAIRTAILDWPGAIY